MVLKSKSFIVSHAAVINNITSFIKKEIGLDAFLLKSIQVDPINSNNCRFTVYYYTQPESLVESISPPIGAVFSPENITGNNFDLRILFNRPIDSLYLASGNISFDGIDLDSGRFRVVSNTKNQFLKVSLSGNSYQTSGNHYYSINSSLPFIGVDNTYSIPGGFTLDGSPGIYLGEDIDYKSKRRGEIAIGLVVTQKNNSIIEDINQFLLSNNLDSNSFICSDSIDKGTIIETYIVYLKNLEPQIVRSYPKNNSVFPYTSIPSNLTLTYNTKLDPASLTGNIFQVESDFNTSAPIDSSDITLLSDNRSISIDLSNYITESNMYSILSNAGLASSNGYLKVKPELWNLGITNYNIGSSTSITGDFSQYTTIVSFTGHTGRLDNPHQVTAAQIGAATTGSLAYVSGLIGSISGSGSTGSLSSDALNYLSGSIERVSLELFEHTVDTISAHGITPYGYNIISSSSAEDARSYLEAVYTGDFVYLSGLLTGYTVTGFVSSSLFALHTGNYSNPHNVTVSQIGAATTGNLNYISGELATLSSSFSDHTATTIGAHGISTYGYNLVNASSASAARSSLAAAYTGDLVYVSGLATGYASKSLFQSHTGDISIHFTVNQIDHADIQSVGTYLHDDIDSHIDNTSNPHNVTAAQIGAATTGSLAYVSGLIGGGSMTQAQVLARTLGA